MTDRPVRTINRCRVPGCVFKGTWPAGDPCPYHADDAPPRPPTAAEKRGDQDGVVAGRTTITADIPEHQLRALRRIATDQKPATP